MDQVQWQLCCWSWSRGGWGNGLWGTDGQKQSKCLSTFLWKKILKQLKYNLKKRRIKSSISNVKLVRSVEIHLNKLLWHGRSYKINIKLQQNSLEIWTFLRSWLWNFSLKMCARISLTFWWTLIAVFTDCQK